ncbi:hypothetical protein GT039_37285, partial [Streptomyces sp. SID2955]|nr:hypothetical protein [Streptomyces sp. SID2955]
MGTHAARRPRRRNVVAREPGRVLLRTGLGDDHCLSTERGHVVPFFLLSVGSPDLTGSATRGAVITTFLVFIGLCLLWVFTLVTQDDDPERLHVA